MDAYRTQEGSYIAFDNGVLNLIYLLGTTCVPPSACLYDITAVLKEPSQAHDGLTTLPITLIGISNFNRRYNGRHSSIENTRLRMD
jgi:hypothetical protein